MLSLFNYYSHPLEKYVFLCIVMHKEIIDFLSKTERITREETVTLHCDEYELSLPVPFIRMLLIHGLDYVEYYNKGYHIETESDSTPESKTESDYDTDSD